MPRGPRGKGHRKGWKDRPVAPNGRAAWAIDHERYRWIEGEVQDLMEIARADLPGPIQAGKWISIPRHGGLRRVTLVLFRPWGVFIALAKRDDQPIRGQRPDKETRDG
jgi:hypothetical protein